jgi:hypothetical protein
MVKEPFDVSLGDMIDGFVLHVVAPVLSAYCPTFQKIDVSISPPTNYYPLAGQLFGTVAIETIQKSPA